MDYTADTWLICKDNEKRVFSSAGSEEVSEVFKKYNAVPVIADLTGNDQRIWKELKDIGKAGLPVNLVFPADRSKPPIILPANLTQGIVIEAIEKAAAQ